MSRWSMVGVWLGFVRSALLLAVVLGWVDCCFYSWVVLALLCFLRVTHVTSDTRCSPIHQGSGIRHKHHTPGSVNTRGI